MSQRKQMLDSDIASKFVVYDYGTDGACLQLAADHGGRNIVFLEVAEYVNIHKQPICHHDQGFHPAIQKHFQIAFESAALVVNVGENGQK